LPKIQMEVIPEPEPGTASVLTAQADYLLINPFARMRGIGDIDYVCGACGVVLAARMNRRQLSNFFFKCGNCASYNLIRGT